MSRPEPSPAEAFLVAAGGAALGASAGSLAALAVPGAVVGALNGAISGWRGIYDWRSGRGVAAFVLDSTWALTTTAAGLVAHVAGVVRGDPGYAPELSRRRNRHVYRRGFQLRRRFAITLGNVIGGAGDVDRPARARLVTDHEDVHVWQARCFGPLYPALYAAWMIGGAAAGLVVWWNRRGDEALGRVVESCAYYLNPFEWWAYSRHGQWPPVGKIDRLGWQRPAVRAFSRPG